MMPDRSARLPRAAGPVGVVCPVRTLRTPTPGTRTPIFRGPSALPAALAVLALVTLLGFVAPSRAAAQSIVRGEIEGRVTSASGSPLFEAVVGATNQRTGLTHFATTARDGTFQIRGLPAGEYAVGFESLGYRPLVYTGVPVRPGRILELDGALATAPPPVESSDTLAYSETSGVRLTRTGGRWVNGPELRGTPEIVPGLTEVADLSSGWDDLAGAQGLPGSLTRVYVDGVAFTPARHPFRAADPLALAALPRRGLGQVELLESGMDAEWTGSPGGYVSVGTETAGGEMGGELSGWGSPSQAWDSEDFGGERPDGISYWAGGAADLPVAGDSTRVFVAGEALSVKTPRWIGVDGGLLSAVRDGAGSAEPATDRNWEDELEVFSGLARLDWVLGSGADVTARVNASRARSGGSRYFGAPSFYGQAPAFLATDISGLVSVRAPLGSRFLLELRGGFDRSERAYGEEADSELAPALPSTRVISSRVPLGSAPGTDGSVLRTEFHGGPILHVDLGVHRFKGGVDVSIPSHEYLFAPPLEGTFFFSGVDELRAEQGAYTAVEGGGSTSFTMPWVGAFAQYQWHPLPTLTLTSGVRWDGEFLPRDEIAFNQDWAQLTGLSNRDVPSSVGGWGGRFGITWDLAAEGTTVMHGSVGAHTGRVAPETLHEVILLDGSMGVRRAVGTLGSWPGSPDPAVTGGATPLLALADADLRAPLTTRAVVSLSHSVGFGTNLRFSSTYRRTEYLPRRRDLNRIPLPVAQSNLGRPVYGELAQVGSVLQAVPGSNRRFDAFDRVWALNTDGWSEYAGVSLAVESTFGLLDAFGEYTYSRTEDNWVGAATGLPEARLGPALEGGFGSSSSGAWEKGVSDFDVPHRLVVGADLRFEPPGLVGAALGGTFRMQSGYPFTPSYPVGSDVNADGSSYNDPAFVPDDPAIRELAREWDCLDAWIGRVVERNACRAPMRYSLDARLRLTVAEWPGGTVDLLLEGFNLLDATTSPRDGALLLVDPDGSVTGQGTGTVQIPTVVNPSFGEPLFPTSPGRRARIGLRVGGS